MGFSMKVLVCGVEVGVFSMWVFLWVFWWFHLVGLTMGLSVPLGLRYRLLWFGSSGGLGGVGMVRKWKW